MSDAPDLPEDEKAVEAADDHLAAEGESTERLTGMSDADANAPGLMGEATGADAID